MDPDRPSSRPYKLAMGIGGENRVEHLRKTSLQRFARITGLGEELLFSRASELASLIDEQLESVFDESDLASAEGLDELASRYVPRIRKLCQTTIRNLSRTGTNYYVPNIAKAR